MRVLASIIGCALLACGTGDDVLLPASLPLTFTVTPPGGLALRVGDTTSVAIGVGNVPSGATPTVRWASDDIAIATVDPQTATTDRARVRAVGVGSTVVRFSVTAGSLSANGSVPVTVAASAP